MAKAPSFIDPASNADFDPIESPAQRASRQSSEAGAASSRAGTARTNLELKYLEDELKLKAEKARQDLINAQRQNDTLNEGQGKAADFYRRAYAANKTFDNLNLDPDSFFDVAFRDLAPGLQSHVSSDERNTARSAVTNFLTATLRMDSGAAIGPSEFVKQYQIYFPSSGAGPKEIAEKKRLRELAIRGFASEAGPVGIEQANRDLIAAGYMPPPKGDKAAEKSGIVPRPLGEQEQPATPVARPGEGFTPAPTAAGGGAAETVIQLPPEGQQAVVDYIRQQGNKLTEEGLTAFVNNQFKQYGLPAAVAPGGASRSLKALREGQPFGGVGAARKPLSATERTVNDALTNPLLGGVAGATVGATANLMPEVVGLVSPEAQAKMERTISDTREINPGYNVGEVVGSIYGAGKLGGALAPSLRAAGVAEGVAPSVANVVFGTTQGAAEAPPGSRLSGAGTGAVLSAAGEAAPFAASRVLKPNTPEEVAFLRNRGVTLTPGQTLGGRAARVEEIGSKLLLGGGDIAIASRKQAFDDFNREFLNDAGSHIGFRLPDAKLKPTERMKLTRKAFDQAYDNARAGMSFVPDQKLAQEVADFQAQLGSDLYDPTNATRLQKLLDNQLLREITSPNASPERYKRLSSLLRKRRDHFSKAENWDMVDGVDKLQAMIDGAARRNSTPESIAALDKADRGYAQFARAQEAGRMAGSEPGAFTPAQLMSVERRGDTTVRGRAFNEGDTLAQQWADAGQKVLGNVEPDSGTATRLAIGAPMTGATAFDPTGLGYVANAALGVSNLPGVKQGLTALIAGKRPKVISDLGGLMQKYQPVLGAGTGAALREAKLTPDEPSIRIDQTGSLTAPAQVQPSEPPPRAPEGLSVKVGGRTVAYDPVKQKFVDTDTGEEANSLIELVGAAPPVQKARGGRVKLPPARSQAELYSRYLGGHR